MLPRALAPILFCAPVLWPLQALACINSMDIAAKDFSQSYWPDLLFWTAGAVFMNRVVLDNVWGKAGASGARRGFFAAVGIALIVLVEAVSAGGPFLNFSATELHLCKMSVPNLVALVASPVLLFVMQAVWFYGPGRQWFGARGRLATTSLVLTSVVLVLGLGFVREVFILPVLCDNPALGFEDIHGY